ncbi:DNA-methyltransferase [Rosenbergiella epipactidis]|uniref:DNA-methyltransferase n=1 Tax=Rosenbergiella epipactidis TaxID=1544694 RepID=UPI001F4EF794|nr:DNA methyltransferase [Rosenbergiella epipactidis]
MRNQFTLHNGDCLEVLKTFADNSIDSIVTDPPYGISFMAHKWDHEIPSVDVFRECLRVLKPGGHILCFAGTKTQHRMAVNIEDAGFEIRDMIGWMYGSGFPKSMDVSKAVDGLLTKGRCDSKAIKKVNESRPGLEKVRTSTTNGHSGFVGSSSAGPSIKRDTPITNEALEWKGWGTALKPAFEPITVARKPFKGTVAANVLAHGTGAINIDRCRVPFVSDADESESKGKNQHAAHGNDSARQNTIYGDMSQGVRGDYDAPGRWPANIIHDGSPDVLATFPEQSSTTGKRKKADRVQDELGVTGFSRSKDAPEYTDSGSPARFFYCAKTSPKDRHEGLDRPTNKLAHGSTLRQAENLPKQGNYHSTVKPFELMKYLCELFTPTGGVILDPFMGSGSTGKAAVSAGFNFVGVEIDAGYFDIAMKRIAHAQALCSEAKHGAQ